MRGLGRPVGGPPRPLTGPPTGFPAGWYPDPFGAPADRYYDGRQWTNHMSGHFAPARRVEHKTLDVRAAIGAAVVLLVSLVTSRYVIDGLVRYE